MSNTKFKISPIERDFFPAEKLKVDPYWDDLYNPPQRKKKDTCKRIKNK